MKNLILMVLSFSIVSITKGQTKHIRQPIEKESSFYQTCYTYLLQSPNWIRIQRNVVDKNLKADAKKLFIEAPNQELYENLFFDKTLFEKKQTSILIFKLNNNYWVIGIQPDSLTKTAECVVFCGITAEGDSAMAVSELEYGIFNGTFDFFETNYKLSQHTIFKTNSLKFGQQLKEFTLSVYDDMVFYVPTFTELPEMKKD